MTRRTYVANTMLGMPITIKQIFHFNVSLLSNIILQIDLQTYLVYGCTSINMRTKKYTNKGAIPKEYDGIVIK